MAATAAGVGALCSGSAAEAKVVYTPANVKIVRNIGLVLFDVNHDGIADFWVEQHVDIHIHICRVPEGRTGRAGKRDMGIGDVPLQRVCRCLAQGDDDRTQRTVSTGLSGR